MVQNKEVVVVASRLSCLEIKNVSKKKYIILVETLIKGKIPTAVRHGVRNGHSVLKYKFIAESLKSNKLQNTDAYKVDVQQVQILLNKPAPM